MSGDEGRGRGWGDADWQQPGHQRPPYQQPAQQRPSYQQQPRGSHPPTSIWGTTQPSTAWAPAQQPAYPTPIPPRRSRNTGAVVAVVGCVLVVVALAVATIVVATDDGDSDDGETAATSESTATTTTSTRAPVTTAGPAGPGIENPDTGEAVDVKLPDDYVVASDPAMPVTLSVPPTWVWAPVTGDGSGVGARLAPGLPDVAERIDEGMSMTPRGLYFMAVPAGLIKPSTTFFDNVIVLDLPAPLPSDEEAREDVILSEVEALADKIDEVSYIAGAAGPVLRVRYEADAGMQLEFIEYWVPTDDGDLVLTITAESVEQYVEAADAMAATLVAV